MPVTFKRPARPDLTLAYLTVRWPYGRGEEFLADEVESLTAAGVKLLVIPRVPPGPTETPRSLPDGVEVLGEPALPALHASRAVASTSHFASAVMRMTLGTTRPTVAAKNFLVVRRAARIAMALRDRRIAHIHAHWGTTTATVGYVVSATLGIPWSFTVHRGDILANNQLAEKARTASFVRCISEQGLNWVATLVPRAVWTKLHVVHMGVSVPSVSDAPPATGTRPVTIAVPARLERVKGHAWLIDACRQLAEQITVPFRCLCYGEGPLRAELESAIRTTGLDEAVQLAGHMPRERLLEHYRRGEIDIVVLPSVTLEEGVHEGIPVALMEAMVHGLPVVATRSGAIGELVRGDCGFLVQQKDSEALAAALALLITQPELRAQAGAQARQRIIEQFSARQCARELLDLMGVDTGRGRARRSAARCSALIATTPWD
jgi:glycosyltransferase involved in cell wall biosynthesis